MKAQPKKSTSRVVKVIEKISELAGLTKKLNSSEAYNKKTFVFKHDTVSQMADVASKINQKFLSKETKDKISDLMDTIDTFTSRDRYEGRKHGENKGFKTKLENASTLPGKLKFLAREIKSSNTNDGHDDKHGNLFVDNETISEIKDLLVEASKEYGNNKATDVMNYKLF